MKKPSGAADSLYNAVAETLRKDLPIFRGVFLPPIRVLAQRYGVSQPTMRKALHVLKGNGELSFYRGGRLRITGRQHDGKADSKSILEAVHLIKTKIEDGSFKAGCALPKYDYFILTHRIGRTTLCAALMALCTQRLVHKKGRRWFAGPPRAPAVSPLRSSTGAKPVILVVMPSYDTFAYYMRFFFTRPLMQTFLNEINAAGFAPLVAFRNRGDMPHIAAAGLEETLRLIRNIKNRYSGTLIIQQRGSREESLEWAAALAAYKKPVCIYHDYELPVDDTVPRMQLRNCTWAYWDENAGVALALEALYCMKHRRMAYVDSPVFRNENWQKQRFERLRKQAAASGGGAVIEKIELQDAIWEEQNPDPDRNRLISTESAVMRSIRKFFADSDPAIPPHSINAGLNAAFLRSAPSLVQGMKRTKCTAIITPNDDVAAGVYLWLTHAGVRIPGDISLVSFDNRPEVSLYPFSTVDFGFQELGYRIAHWIIRDVPVARDANGNLASLPQLFDRGSIAVASNTLRAMLP